MDHGHIPGGNMGMMGGFGNMAIQSAIITNVMGKIKSGNAMFDIFIGVFISSIFGMVFTGIPNFITNLYEKIYKNIMYYILQGNSQKELTIKYVEVLNLKSGCKYRNGDNHRDQHLVSALELYIQENNDKLKPMTITA